MTDYSKCTLNTGDRFVVALKSVIIALVLGYLFFGHVVFGIFLFLPLLIFALRVKRKKSIEMRCEKIKWEFRDALCSMAASMEAGYSVEGSLMQAEKDMILMHGEDALIVDELRYMLRRLHNGGNIEEAFADFAERSGNDDAKIFSEVFTVAKRSGGELLKVINSITGVMQEKLEANREIALLIASKRYEICIMKYMPPAIIAYLRITSSEFIEPLYQGNGRVFMLIILPVWFLLIYISEKIMNIKV